MNHNFLKDEFPIFEEVMNKNLELHSLRNTHMVTTLKNIEKKYLLLKLISKVQVVGMKMAQRISLNFELVIFAIKVANKE